MAYRKVYRKRRPVSRVNRRRKVRFLRNPTTLMAMPYQNQYPSNNVTRYLKSGYANPIYRKVPFPDSMVVLFTYTERITIASASGVVNSYIFRLNSLFDHNQSGIGSQPRYYDILLGANDISAVYGYYRVLSAKITASFVAAGSASSSPMRVGLLCRNSGSSVASTLEEVRMRPHSVVRTLTSSNAKGTLTLSRKCSMKRMLGIKDLKDDPDTKATYAASPVQVVNADIYVESSDQSSSNTTIVYVTIHTLAQLYQHQDVADS